MIFHKSSLLFFFNVNENRKSKTFHIDLKSDALVMITGTLNKLSSSYRCSKFATVMRLLNINMDVNLFCCKTFTTYAYIDILKN